MRGSAASPHPERHPIGFIIVRSPGYVPAENPNWDWQAKKKGWVKDGPDAIQARA